MRLGVGIRTSQETLWCAEDGLPDLPHPWYFGTRIGTHVTYQGLAMVHTKSSEYRLEITFVGPEGEEIAGYKRRNPDGSFGGLVAESARIDDTAIVEEGAFVGPGAIIGAHAVIRRSARIDDNQVVEANRVVW